MTVILDFVGAVFVAVGVALIAIGGIGLIRLPDVYNRINAVSKAAGLGLVCVLFGTLLMMPSPATAFVLLLAIVLQLFTAPLGAYAIGSAAYRQGIPPAEVTRYDEYGGPGGLRAPRGG